ncbi:MAG: NAD(P)/FAD-dependent oxidoreductase [Promethearchaeia archaeon]
MKEYDAVIVGGGIAGSVAGRYLAKHDFDTLIVESAYTPREKPCSAIQFKYFERIIGKEIPPEKLCTNPLNRLYMELPSRKSMKLPFSMLNFTRDVFDDWLNQIAEEAGSQFRDGVRCEDFEREEDGFLVTLHPKHEKREKVKTKYLIAADGLTSSIRKKVRPQDFDADDPGVTLNYYFDDYTEGDLDPNTLYQFWNTDYSNLMFAWSYKKNDKWVIGTGHTDDVASHCNKLVDYIEDKFNFNGNITKKEGFASQFCLQDPDHVYLGNGNLFFIGDAAGLVDLYRGLGMDAAALSGRRLAKAIRKGEKKGKPPLKYYKKYMRRTRRKIRKNTEKQMESFENNKQLSKYLKRSSLKTGICTLFGSLVNKILPVNKLILLPY